MRPRAQIGDRLVVPARVRDGKARVGVVVEVLGAEGLPPFSVRWEDGSQTLVYPSSAAHVVSAGPDEEGLSPG